jgi:outer membrane protein/adhesin transport system outer membrane protein
MQAEGDLANQRAVFVRLTGQMPGTLEQPKLVIDLPKSQDEAVSLSLIKNPKVLSANYNAAAASKNIIVAKSNLYPELSLVANATHSKEEGVISPERDDRAEALARVTIPLYRTGADYSKIREAEQTDRQMHLAVEDVRNKAKQDVITSWQSLMTARAAIVGRQEVVTSSQEALEGVREESKLGTRTILDVLNAEQEVLDAKINLVRATHDEALSTLQLKAAIGELSAETLHLSTKLYDPVKNFKSVRNKWVGFANVKDQKKE